LENHVAFSFQDLVLARLVGDIFYALLYFHTFFLNFIIIHENISERLLDLILFNLTATITWNYLYLEVSLN